MLVEIVPGSVADHCLRLGLSVGDTIFGREEGPRGIWHEARLTLLWVGKQEAMWLEQTRTDAEPEWSEPEEAGDWCLDARPWQKVASSTAASGVAPIDGGQKNG